MENLKIGKLENRKALGKPQIRRFLTEKTIYEPAGWFPIFQFSNSKIQNALSQIQNWLILKNILYFLDYFICQNG